MPWANPFMRAAFPKSSLGVVISMTSLMHALHVVLISLYLGTLAILTVYGLHRYVQLYLYFKHARKKPQPAGRWQALPRVSVQLPMYNEQYVAERVIEAALRWIIRASCCKFRSWTIRRMNRRRSPNPAAIACAIWAMISNTSIARIGPATRRGPWPTGCIRRRVNLFSSLTRILCRRWICCAARWTTLPIRMSGASSRAGTTSTAPSRSSPSARRSSWTGTL